MKKNLLKIPPLILDRIRTFDQDDVVAASVKLLRPADIDRYSHLGIALNGSTLVLPAPSPPQPDAGRFSRANLFGEEKVRKDLPKVKKSFGFFAPNWGDWSRGSHLISWDREVYQRDFYPPKEVDLSATLLGEKDGGYIVKFAIDQVINRRTPNFEFELLYNLNLLQENIGAADVFPSAATLAEYAATVRVDWQILPPGTVDEIVAAMLARSRTRPDEAQVTVMRERIAAMSKLKPEAYVAGTDGFLRYFGAKFGDDFVVFENVRYGNALYLMFEDWQRLSQRSRVELLANPDDNFLRLEHRDGWEEQLQAQVRAYRKRRRAEKPK
jgi:hypothetical protein